MWVYGQSFVGHRRTSYRECPTKIRGLVRTAQTSVHNGADTRPRRFYHGGLGKSIQRQKPGEPSWGVAFGAKLLVQNP